MTRRAALFMLRVGLPALLFIAGVVLLLTVEGSVRWDGWAMCWGSAFSLLLVTFLVRMGNSGERDREAEDEARRYYTRHGHWPDEAPSA
jgi:hypothetical protein